MLHVLPTTAYARVRPLLGNLAHHLTVMSIAAGDTSGVIYVDDSLQPRTVLCRYGHRLYFGGSADQPFFNRALKDLFDREICPQILAHDGSALVMYYDDSENWQTEIERVGGERLSEPFQRSYYRRTTPTFEQPILPENMVIQPIDSELLERTNLVGYDELVEELQSERVSVADFLAHSFGFCALADDVIAGMCTSEYNSGCRCEVGINTMENFRRRGVARALVAHFVEAAFAQGIDEIGWHCWKANIPSVATALAAKFEHIRDYPAYVLNLK